MSAKEAYHTVSLFDWTGGICDRRHNPLAFPQNALMAGENIDLIDHGLKTRPGSSIVSAGSLPAGEIVTLQQVRFPTNQVSYLVAQVKQAASNNPRTWEASTGEEGDNISTRGAWDSFRGVLWKYGGGYDLQYYSWDADAWTRLSTTGGPDLSIIQYGMIYDPVGDRLLLFGGKIGAVYQDSFWEYDIDAGAWTLLSTTGAPPSARGYLGCVYNSADRTMVVFGGRASWYFQVDPYYELNLSALVWSDISGANPPVDLGGTRPGCIYMADRNAVFIAGGSYLETCAKECAILDLTTQAWTVFSCPDYMVDLVDYFCSGGSPVYCEGGNQVYFFYHNHVFSYDLDSATWTQLDDDADFAYGPIHITDGGDLILDEGGTVLRIPIFCPGGWSGAPAYNRLYASPDDLPASNTIFQLIAPLSDDAEPISVAVLNDRAVIAQIKDPPLVWGGCMADDGSDWMYPKAVLVSQDGKNFYDVSSYVLDTDTDASADIGGIRSFGFVAVCCDTPKVQGFYFEMGSPNRGRQEISQYQGVVGYTDVSQAARQNLKGLIEYWRLDSPPERISLNASAVVNKGGSPNEVGLPATAHGFVAGQKVRITGSINYDGIYAVEPATSGDEIVIRHAYTAEILTSAAAAQHYAEGDLNAAVVVNKGGAPNKVGLPATDHGFTASQKVKVSGTVNYEGIYTVDSSTTVNEIVIEHAYTAEALTSTARAQYHWDAKGHFEGAEVDLDDAAVVNKGGAPNKVGLPATGHGFAQGCKVRIYGTANYDGSYTVDAASTQNEIVIERSYTAETLTSTAKARRRLTLGQGNSCPDVEKGLFVSIGESDHTIVNIVSTGEPEEAVELDSPHVSAAVTGVYGINVQDGSLCVNHATGGLSAIWSKTPIGGSSYPKTSVRQIIAGSEIPASGRDIIRLTIKSGSSSQSGCLNLSYCSIVERDGTTADGVAYPTQITFNHGQPGFRIDPNAEITSDEIAFTVDEAKDYLITMDLAYVDVTIPAHYPPFSIGSQQLIPAQQIKVSGLASSNGAGFYYKAWDLADGTAAYNRRNVDGFTLITGRCLAAVRLESKVLYYLPTALFVSHTTDSNNFDISIAEDFAGVTVTENRPGNSKIYHAVSMDNRQTFKVFLSGQWRDIVRNNGSNWQYRDPAGSWQNASGNTLLQALRQAFGVANNQMTKGQLEAITSAQWKQTGGLTIHLTGTLDFAQAMRADGQDYPSVTGYTVTYTDMGTTLVEGWKSGGWTTGAGWTDNTVEDLVPLAVSGSVIYNGAEPFEADYHVLNETPGYWFRFKTNGTSEGTAITRLLYKAPCQPLANIGDGRPDTPLGFIYHDVSANLIRDYTVEVSDNALTELSKADVPMDVDDYLYVAYLTRFNEIEITPYEKNNTAAATLSAKYWTGEAWAPLAIVDGTSANGRTFAQKGKVSWTIPRNPAWKMRIPFDANFPLGHWMRFKVSANLSTTAAISEVRVYGVPDPLTKHKFAVTVQDRVALLSRPDAPDQADISRPLEEYGFTGPDSASYRIGGMDAIQCAVAAWNGLFVGKTETWHQLVGNDPTTFRFDGVEAARHIPVNSRVIVKAPMGGIDAGSLYGLFYINRFGAFVSTGLHTDSTWNTGRSAMLSDSVSWWDETAAAHLDLANLHNACGEYWPVKNWIVWAVPMSLDGNPQGANNRLIVFDLSLRAWLPPFTISVASLSCVHHRSVEAPGKLGDVGLYAGDYNGRILRLFGPSDTADLGQPIPAWVETGWLSMGSPQWTKLIRRLQVYGQTSAGRDLILKIWKDGNSDPKAPDKTILLNQLNSLQSRFFGQEEESVNIQGRFFKFRIECTDLTHIYGLQIGVSLIREWGAL